MEPEDSLQCSQEPATGPYPQPDASSPHLPTWLSSYLQLGILNGLFPSGFLTKILFAFLTSPMCATWLIHLVMDLMDLITLITYSDSCVVTGE